MNRRKVRIRQRKNCERELYKIISYLVPLILFVMATIIFLILYINNRDGKYASYKETSNIDYKVYLNENEFYKDDFLGENGQYVSGLIKYIMTNFNYNMEVNSKLDYSCTYKIDAILNVIDKNTKNVIYEYTENLLEPKNVESEYNKIDINENIKIDFSHFNSMANEFINTYKLASNSESTLTVNMIVKNDKTEESVTSLIIPLAKQTIAIDENSKNIENKDNQLLISESNKLLKKIFVLGFTLCLIETIRFTYKLIIYLKETTTDENKYKREVKKILLSYGEYINKTDDYQFNLDEYEIIRVKKFLDLVKIKEDLSRPILMIENNEKTNTMFAVTDNTKFIYLFTLNLHQELLAAKNESYKEKEKELV